MFRQGKIFQLHMACTADSELCPPNGSQTELHIYLMYPQVEEEMMEKALKESKEDQILL